VSSTSISEKARLDIDRQVAKVLTDLGNPEPPLRLELVREVQKLDRTYYSTAQECAGMFARLVHNVRVGLKQVALRPTLLLEAIRSASLKALLLPDQRRILIDKDLHPFRQRWGEAHEIGHDLIPWHKFFVYGDDESTLHVSFQEQIEAEANYAAGRLLFLRERFAHEIHSSHVSLGRIFALAQTFGNSKTSALWRVVEASPLPAVGVIGASPAAPGVGLAEAMRHVIVSDRFKTEFSNTTPFDLLMKVRTYCSRRRGPCGEAEVVLDNDRGDTHVFRFESFNNTHDVLTLGTWQRSHVGIAIPVPSIAGNKVIRLTQ
jgi:hypothetical protein